MVIFIILVVLIVATVALMIHNNRTEKQHAAETRAFEEQNPDLARLFVQANFTKRNFHFLEVKTINGEEPKHRSRVGNKPFFYLEAGEYTLVVVHHFMAGWLIRRIRRDPPREITITVEPRQTLLLLLFQGELTVEVKDGGVAADPDTSGEEPLENAAADPDAPAGEPQEDGTERER